MYVVSNQSSSLVLPARQMIHTLKNLIPNKSNKFCHKKNSLIIHKYVLRLFLFIGLFIDLISDSFLGLNAIFFCLITYLINIYANAFKLFSYLQICIFFGLSSSAYVGLSQMIINIWNFSYVTLFMSTILNIILCILMAVLSAYLPNFVKRRL